MVAARARLEKMQLDMRIKDELKTVALGTSKINYMDPRITIAWCKSHDVPIEKVRACETCCKVHTFIVLHDATCMFPVSHQWCSDKALKLLRAACVPSQVFNKSLLAKFAWSMDVEPTFRF